MNDEKTVTITKEEYCELLELTECIKLEKIYRKAPLAAKKAAEQHLRLLEEIEQMDTPKHYLQGYNRYAEVKITENDLNKMREAYHDFGMYGLLPKEYQL